MTDLIRETNEAIREEKTMRFFRLWAPWLAVLVVIIVVSVGFYQYFKNKYNDEVAVDASIYTEITKDKLINLNNESIEKLNSILKGTSGYSLAAHFRLANHYLALKDFIKARNLYNEVANNDWHSIYTSYAKLQLLNLDYLQNKNNSSFQKNLNKYILDTESDQNYWHAQAMYLGAGAALEAGDKIIAKSWLNRLNTFAQTPDVLRQHSLILLQDL